MPSLTPSAVPRLSDALPFGDLLKDLNPRAELPQGTQITVRGVTAEAAPTELDREHGATPVRAYGQVLHAFRRGPRSYVPLLCDLGPRSVGDAVDLATHVISAAGIYPGDQAELFVTFAQIRDWAAAHAVDQIADLSADTAAALIRQLAGVDDLTFPKEPHEPGISARVREDRAEAIAVQRRDAHRVRNALIALRAVLVLARSRNRTKRHLQDSLAWGLPALPAQEDRRARALTDEEILLGRLMVEIDLAEHTPEPRNTLAYLIAEAAVRCGESTSLDTRHLDDRYQPTRVKPPGPWEFGKRKVPFTDYQRATLPRALVGLRDGVQRLTYDGDLPGTRAASSSTYEVVMRHLQRAGVDDPDVTHKSLSLWRVEHTLLNGDFTMARRLHGGATKNLLADLKLTSDETDSALHKVIHLHRNNSSVILATVSNEDFYDGSTTRKNPSRQREDQAAKGKGGRKGKDKGKGKGKA